MLPAQEITTLTGKINMKVLIVAEFSGTVREAFRNRCHDAFSNDLLPSDDGSPYHLQEDCIDAIRSDTWDIIGMHLPCTALAVSGNSTYGRGMPKHHARLESIDWTMAVWDLATTVCDRVYLENPVGVLPMKASQYVQPWMYGHPESKKTGLWLHGLSPLEETDNVKEQFDNLPKNQQQRLHYLPPSEDRWKIRSKTFTGIANAMANQWG